MIFTNLHIAASFCSKKSRFYGAELILKTIIDFNGAGSLTDKIISNLENSQAADKIHSSDRQEIINMFIPQKGVRLNKYLNRVNRFSFGKNQNNLFAYKPHSILAPEIFRQMFEMNQNTKKL